MIIATVFLLALSAWPAAVSHRAFAGTRAKQAVAGELASSERPTSAAELAFRRCQAELEVAEVALTTASDPALREQASKRLERGCTTPTGKHTVVLVLGETAPP